MRPAPSLLVVMLLSASATYGQDQFWYFGDGAAISFAGGSPTALSGGTMQGIDNMTAVSGQTGQVLCYSNGMDVFDATHALMLNGDAVGGSNNGGQCALIVPRPLSSEYYLFTVGQWNSSDGLRYSVINMTLNGGLGAVTIKGQVLLPISTERLEAVRNPYDGSWWLLTHAWDSDQFLAYHITSTGLDTVPVISAVGSVHAGGSPWGYNAVGQLTASRTGSLLACGIYSDAAFEVFDFDPATGIVSNPRSLPGYPNAWGAAFSPDASKLYVTKWYDDEVIQVDLAAGSWADVQASATLIGTTTLVGSFGGYNAGYLQAGPDEKIYVAKFGQDNISVINAPNNVGAGCGFVDNGFTLGTGICKAGLCRTVQIPHGEPTSVPEDQLFFTLACYDRSADRILLTTAFDPGTTVQLFDASGRMVRSREVTKAQRTLDIPAGSLVQGTYAVSVSCATRQWTGRVVIAR